MGADGDELGICRLLLQLEDQTDRHVRPRLGSGQGFDPGNFARKISELCQSPVVELGRIELPSISR